MKNKKILIVVVAILLIVALIITFLVIGLNKKTNDPIISGSLPSVTVPVDPSSTSDPNPNPNSQSGGDVDIPVFIPTEYTDANGIEYTTKCLSYLGISLPIPNNFEFNKMENGIIYLKSTDENLLENTEIAIFPLASAYNEDIETTEVSLERIVDLYIPLIRGNLIYSTQNFKLLNINIKAENIKNNYVHSQVYTDFVRLSDNNIISPNTEMFFVKIRDFSLMISVIGPNNDKLYLDELGNVMASNIKDEYIKNYSYLRLEKAIEFNNIKVPTNETFSVIERGNYTTFSISEDVFAPEFNIEFSISQLPKSKLNNISNFEGSHDIAVNIVASLLKASPIEINKVLGESIYILDKKETVISNKNSFKYDYMMFANGPEQITLSSNLYFTYNTVYLIEDGENVIIFNVKYNPTNAEIAKEYARMIVDNMEIS